MSEKRHEEVMHENRVSFNINGKESNGSTRDSNVFYDTVVSPVIADMCECQKVRFCTECIMERWRESFPKSWCMAGSPFQAA